MDHETFELDHFSGSLEILLHLIQKHEVNICDISLKEIMTQYVERLEKQADMSIDRGSEFMSSTASLLWIKSKSLLPKHEQIEPEEEFLGEDPHFDIIHHLVDYCRFKDIAKELSEKGGLPHLAFSRGGEPVSDLKKSLGIAHLSLTDLAALFQQALQKYSDQTKVVEEEEWRVSDKISYVRKLIKSVEKLCLIDLFTQTRSKDELIVTFLAILELMKLGELLVFKELETNIIILSSSST